MILLVVVVVLFVFTTVFTTVRLIGQHRTAFPGHFVPHSLTAFGHREQILTARSRVSRLSSGSASNGSDTSRRTRRVAVTVVITVTVRVLPARTSVRVTGDSLLQQHGAGPTGCCKNDIVSTHGKQESGIWLYRPVNSAYRSNRAVYAKPDAGKQDQRAATKKPRLKVLTKFQLPGTPSGRVLRRKKRRIPRAHEMRLRE